jgi:dipeptidyl aminopeptidase/acylaminoacyl peptidase
MKRILTSLVVIALLIPSLSHAAQKKHPFGFEDMMKLQRLGEPQVSPNGKWIIFSVGKTNLKSNKIERDLWLVSSKGEKPRRLTRHAKPDYGATWFPKGNRIAYVSVRNKTAQIWTMNPFTLAKKKITNLPVDVDNLSISPDGKLFSFTAEVYPDCNTLSCTAKRDAKKEKDPVKARAYEELLFRHWDTWEDGKRSHVFVMSATGGKPIDMTRGLNTDVPTKPWGGTEEIAFSPDGKEIAYTAKVAPNPALHTNVDIFIADIATQSSQCITCENKAWDTAPAYSPDGRYIAYLAMKRPGYESDRLRIVLYDRITGKKRVLTEKWDRSPSSITWSPDGNAIYTTASNLGNKSIFTINVRDGEVKNLVDKHYNANISIAENLLVFTQDSFTSPKEIFSYNLANSNVTKITDINGPVLKNVVFSKPEEFWFKGARGDRVQGWFFKPVGYKEGEKYPLAYFIHGGPQGAFGDHFHYRWNMEVAPGRGYAAATVNFHGSVGFGQKFTDSIRGDWGGKPYKDIMKGLDFVLKKHKWIAPDRVCALGASYGGYMVNWIEGHTDRFACLVNHDGDFSTFGAYYNTEELWFPEWDMKGTAFKNPKNFTKWSPDQYVKNWKTPMLVIHGARDYRVVDTEGISTFTALKRMGVPARFLYFPNENHWVLKPLNSRRWHSEVYDWMDRWTEVKAF